MRNIRYKARVMHTLAGQDVTERVSVPTADPEEVKSALEDRIKERWVQPDAASIQSIRRVRDDAIIWAVNPESEAYWYGGTVEELQREEVAK